MREITQVVVAAICLLFAHERLQVPPPSVIHREDIFKDVAHLWVGAMFGAGLAFLGCFLWLRRRCGGSNAEWMRPVLHASLFFLLMGLALTGWEIFVFKLHEA
jgi:hypothetical protein